MARELPFYCPKCQRPTSANRCPICMGRTMREMREETPALLNPPAPEVAPAASDAPSPPPAASPPVAEPALGDESRASMVIARGLALADWQCPWCHAVGVWQRDGANAVLSRHGCNDAAWTLTPREPDAE